MTRSTSPYRPSRPVLANLMDSRMVQRLVSTRLGVAIASDPTAMAWLQRLRTELLVEERCREREHTREGKPS